MHKPSKSQNKKYMRKRPTNDVALAAALEMVSLGVLSVDEEGRIWRHMIRNKRGSYDKIATRRAESKHPGGYLQVGVKTPAGYTQVYAHRIVKALQTGTLLTNIDVNHLNGRKGANYARNLELATQRENNEHAVVTGLRKMHGIPADVKRNIIFLRRSTRMSAQEIGEMLKVKTSVVNSTWRSALKLALKGIVTLMDKFLAERLQEEYLILRVRAMEAEKHPWLFRRVTFNGGGHKRRH